MKYDRIYFTTGISDIDNATGNFIDNGSCIVLFGNDVVGMLSFVEHNIWGRPSKDINNPESAKSVILTGSGFDILNLNFDILAKINPFDFVNSNSLVSDFFEMLDAVLKNKETDSETEKETENNKQKKEVCFLFYPSVEISCFGEILNFLIQFKNYINKLKIKYKDFLFYSLFVLYENTLEKTDQKKICCFSDILLKFKMSEETNSIKRQLIIYHIKNFDKSFNQTISDEILNYFIQNNKIVIEKTKRIY